MFSCNCTAQQNKEEDDVDQNWPEVGIPLNITEFGKQLLAKCLQIDQPNTETISIDEILNKSSKFPIKFGSNNCRISSQPIERYRNIKSHVASVYPLIHERVLALYLAFLEHKSKYGTPMEMHIYKNMTVTDLVQRLIIKRCVLFCGNMDCFKLMTGQEGWGGDNFISIGTEKEKAPLVLENLLSYDEMKLSAFLSLSSHTEFLNNGTRNNRAIIETDKSKFEQEGVIIGLIGPRFQKPNCMDWQDCIITRTQNCSNNGYGQPKKANDKFSAYRSMWNRFYEHPDFLYETVIKKSIKNARFYKYGDQILDNLMLKRRYIISIDTLLIEAESRAKILGKKAFLHVVGIGLGVWQIVPHQPEIFMQAFEERLKVLGSKLSHVSVIHFSWFPFDKCGELKNAEVLEIDSHPEKGFRIFISNRNPADKLADEFKDMLLVVSYAWDSNALPGNEFWDACLDSSSDPAAACSSLITEIHNGHINEYTACGNNLHIASMDKGVMHLNDYIRANNLVPADMQQ